MLTQNARILPDQMSVLFIFFRGFLIEMFSVMEETGFGKENVKQKFSTK